MTAFLKELLLSALCLLGSNYLGASTYYFSTLVGNDSRGFTEAQDSATPWQTIDKLNHIVPNLRAGDSLLFHRGEIFYGGMVINQSGTLQAPIVISAYGEGLNPVISGFTFVTSWTSSGHGIYESNALVSGSGVNMVVIDDINYAKGRYPNANSENSGYLTLEVFDSTSITDSESWSSTNWVGAQLVLRTSHWTLERRLINAQSGHTMSFGSSTKYPPRAGFGYFLQDHLNTLDQYGEWYFSPVSKKLFVYFGEEGPTSNTVVKVAAIDVLVAPQGDHIVLENLSLEGANQHGIFYKGFGRTNLGFLNSEIKYSGIDAVFLEGWSNFTIANCTLVNSNNCALRLLAQDPYTTITDNTIINTGMQPGMGGDGDGNYSAVISTTKGLVAEYNTILNTGYIGIAFAEEDILVKNNFINNFCQTLDDGGGIYTYYSKGASPHYDRRIIENIVMNGIGAPDGTPSSEASAEGIYIDDLSNEVEVRGNSVAHCSDKGIFVHNAQELFITENTIFDNGTQFFTKHDAHSEAITSISLVDNIFFSKQPSQWISQLKSNSKDFIDMGYFENNFYVRPLNDSLTMMIEYETSEGALVIQPLTLSDWQKKLGHDQGSKKSPVRVIPYAVDSIVGANQVDNGSFDSNIDDSWCWSPSSNCLTSWKPNSNLGSGVIEVAGQGPSYLGFNSGPIKKGGNYLLRFTAVASEESNILIYLQQNSSPWKRLSSTQATKIDMENNHYELMFSIAVTDANSSFQFAFNDQGVTYWFDNIEFFEVEASLTNPDSCFRFEYNPSKQAKSINLTENYIDLKGQHYSGTINLAPFESIVLIRSNDSTPETISDLHDDPDGRSFKEPNNKSKSHTERDLEPIKTSGATLNSNLEKSIITKKKAAAPTNQEGSESVTYVESDGKWREKSSSQRPKPKTAIFDLALYPNPLEEKVVF